MGIKKKTLKTNGYFGILEDPKPHKQHPNQQEGLDLYIRVVNFRTGAVCFKKIYKNKKGLHFKHSMVHYLKEFVHEAIYIPFQIHPVNYEHCKEFGVIDVIRSTI